MGGARRNVPSKHGTAAWLGSGSGSQSLKGLVDFSGSCLWLFLEDEVN